MDQITTQLSVQKINKRMKKKGFSGRPCKLSKYVRIYTKDERAIMYVFERKIRADQMKPNYKRS